MDNERNFPIGPRVAGGAGGRSSMDSFLFHPARASFSQSTSIGSGIKLSFPSLPAPLPQSSSSILTRLLCPNIPLFPSNQSFLGSRSNLVYGPGFSQSVQDLSNNPYGVASTMDAPSLQSAQMEPSGYQNSPVLSPIEPNPPSSVLPHENPSVLSPVHENPSSSPFRQQIPPSQSPPQQSSSFFIPLFLQPLLVYRGFVQIFPSLQAVQTHFQDSCLIWLHLLYFWETMWKLNYTLLLIGIPCNVN